MTIICPPSTDKQICLLLTTQPQSCHSRMATLQGCAVLGCHFPGCHSLGRHLLFYVAVTRQGHASELCLSAPSPSPSYPLPPMCHPQIEMSECHPQSLPIPQKRAAEKAHRELPGRNFSDSGSYASPAQVAQIETYIGGLGWNLRCRISSRFPTDA